MTHFRYLAPAAMALILIAGASASGQTPDEHDAHHVPAQAAAQPAPQTPAPAQPGMMGPGMMAGQGMMMGGPGMMAMMNMMQGGMGPMMMGRGMGMIDRVEGRIAFMKAELKITEDQTPAWNAFADTLRANAKKLGDVRSAMMTRESAARPQTVMQRLDLEEQWLTSRLDGTRATKAALAMLYDVLSAEQKQQADELIGPNVGVGRMMMMRMAARGQ
jgi:hypothetical protein